MVDDSRGQLPWKRGPERGNYHYDLRDQRATKRENRAFPPTFHRSRHDGLEGVPGRARYFELPRAAPVEPYAGHAAPALAARHGSYRAPAYQAPLRSAGLLGREEAQPRPLQHVHLQPPPVPLHNVAAPAASSRSRHYQPYAAGSRRVEPTPKAPLSPLSLMRAPPRPVESWHFAEKPHPVAHSHGTHHKKEWSPMSKHRHRDEHYTQTPSLASSPRRCQSHHGRGFFSISGFESDARSSVGPSLAESRHTTAAVTSGATPHTCKNHKDCEPLSSLRRLAKQISVARFFFRHVLRGENSFSSCSSETGHIIRMMKTQNLPKPPPDNRHSSVRLATVVVLSGILFTLIMSLAFVLETTVLLPLDKANTDVVTKTRALDGASVAANITNIVAPIVANRIAVQPENLADDDEGVEDTSAPV
ncbi:hypothetical protein MRX96_008019 [Rhipicephalus microplus]